MKQALAMGTSLGGGFVVFAVASELGWGVVCSLGAAAIVPAVTLAILLAFVCGHPPGHLTRWIEWQVIRSTARGLLQHQQNTKNEYEN